MTMTMTGMLIFAVVFLSFALGVASVTIHVMHVCILELQRHDRIWDRIAAGDPLDEWTEGLE